MSSITRIETDGGTLAVEVQGQGPLIICSPGLGDTRDAYAPLAAQLAGQGYTVATMDVRGHGDSSAKFNRYGDEATADDFITIIEKLQRGPAVLAGASFSAAAATIAAGRRPELVSGIVLLGPFLRLVPGVFGTVMFHIMPVLFMRPWGSMMWKGYSKTLWPGLDAKAADRAAASTASLTRPGRWSAFQKTVAGLDHRVVAPYIPKVQCPALVIMGDKDPDWSKPLEEAEWVASNFKDSRVVTAEGAGHAPQLERPEIVGKSVLEFFEKLKSSGAIGQA